LNELDVLHREIEACRACVDAGTLTEPPPLVSGDGPAPFMLIGQAPSKTDKERRQMYTGPAAQKLYGWLKSAGFSDEDFGKLIYMTALTKCFPGRLPGKSTDRAPSSRELALCADWLTRQIRLIEPSTIILFGRMAIDRFLGPGSMTDRIGQTFERNNIVYIPLPHSSGASTWLNSPDNIARLTLALDQIRAAREAWIYDFSRSPTASE
jgi:uracil-DNA glycosylase